MAEVKRTDLALEAKECMKEKGELKDVLFEQKEDPMNGIKISRVQIETEAAGRQLGKKKGTYITIEGNEKDSFLNKGTQKRIVQELEKLAGGQKQKKILVVGLGNREITPDALGPLTIDQIEVTRHLFREFGDVVKRWGYQTNVEAIAPGVMAQTGMEMVEIIQGIIEQTKPETVITIDALATRSVKRLFRTVQITDSGISPGAGVGNRRCSIDKETLGIPVIAMGVPTVVDSRTILEEAIEDLFQGGNEKEKQFMEQFHNFRLEDMENMFMTDKEVDQQIKNMSSLLAKVLNEYGINTGKDK